MAKPRIKIYVHHNHFFSPPSTAGKGVGYKFVTAVFSIFYYAGLGVLKGFSLLKSFVVGVCYHTGKAVLSPVIGSSKALLNDIRKTRESLPKRFKVITGSHFSKALFSFGFVAVLAILALGGLKFTAKALDIKNKMLSTAIVGNFYLNQAKDSLADQDFNQAQDQFNQAYKVFNNGQNEINESGQAINRLLGLLPQKREADKLLKAAEQVSRAGQDFLELNDLFSTLKIGQAGVSSEGNQTRQTFENVSSLLNKVRVNLNEATDNVNEVNPTNFPQSQRAEIVDLKFKLNSAQTALENFSEIFELSGSFLLGEKTLLVLFENNNELRASGGFPGTYGFIKLKDGQILSMDISSIYDLDGQLKEVIKPPRPVLNLGPRWFMRDSGWFSDFPESAKEFSSFYEKTGGVTPDMVLALTPNLIVSWLKIFGPIELPNYDVTLTAENFVEKTQAITSISDGLPTNEPKQLLADLVPVLLQKFGSLEPGSWPLVVEALQNDLNSKQLVIYSRDGGFQEKINSLGWGGQVAKSDRDYLSIISSNLGGTKTDLFIEQNIYLKTVIDSQGKVVNELTINTTNTLPDLFSTESLSFIRVLVPEGSKLRSNMGFDYKGLDYPEGQDYKIDHDVYEWEKNAVTDNLTGTVIGKEAGKIFFGNWQSVKGGGSKTIKLVYELPFELNSVDRYSLLVQKQIGSIPHNLSWELDFPGRNIEWTNFDPTLDTGSLSANVLLSKDYFLGLVLKKQ